VNSSRIEVRVLRTKRALARPSWFRCSQSTGSRPTVTNASCNWVDLLNSVQFSSRPIQPNSSMHHYECVALCKDVSLQTGRFCARSLASCIPRSSEDRSSRMFFIQVVRGRPGGRLQLSGGGSKMAWLASAFSSVYVLWTDPQGFEL